MSRARTFGIVALVAGACTLIGGIGWWAVSYWQVWANDYLSLPQASRCLLADSSICRLAAALCTGQHRSFAATYSPWIVWLGAAATLCGAGPLALIPAPRRTDRVTNLEGKTP